MWLDFGLVILKYTIFRGLILAHRLTQCIKFNFESSEFNNLDVCMIMIRLPRGRAYMQNT